MKLPELPWWRTDSYTLAGHNDGPDMDNTDLWGPHGPALVPYFPETGKTGPGWGSDTFMDRYNKLQFSPRRVLAGYNKGFHAFAFVMRSANIVCIDIDGKNGGFEFASQLGFLPQTVAEVSQSGNGYHLFYRTDDTWDPQLGFAKYNDAIGVVQGVDIRGTGCVYHKPTQRWNIEQLAMLPDHISKMLLSRQARRAQAADTITKTLELDKEEIAIMHYELLEELAKPIADGKRNNSLFAIGTKIHLAQVPDWEDKLRTRGVEVGLDEDELDKLIANILKYGAKQP